MNITTQRTKKEIGWVMERTQQIIDYNNARIREHTHLIREKRATMKRLERELRRARE